MGKIVRTMSSHFRWSHPCSVLAQRYETNSKTYWKSKKRLCVRLRSGDKHHLRKSADRKAQISPVSGTNAFLICTFWSADFLSWCLYIPRAQPHAQSLFLFPIVFGINLVHFSMRRKTVQPEIRSFVLLLRSLVTPFDSANFTKNANYFEECNVFGNGECELSAIQEGRNWGDIFGQGKCKTLQ